MARERIELQRLLENFVPEGKKVYFQPPNGMLMAYPCIIYERSDISVAYADNLPYRTTKQYTITVIDTDPDSVIPDRISLLPLCEFNRHFTADNLNHDVFTLYF